MKTDMATTSLMAYKKLVDTGRDKILKARVLKYVLDHPGSTRDDIADATGIRLASVCGAAKPLVDEQLLVERGVDTKTDNPRKLLWPVGPDTHFDGDPEKQGLDAAQMGLF